MSEDDRQEASMRLDVDSDSAGTNVETSRDYGDGTLKEYEIFIESRIRLCEVSRVVYSLMQIQFESFLVTMRNKLTSIQFFKSLEINIITVMLLVCQATAKLN